ncbi:MAG TPA: hypothetical protein PLD25_17625 [Chloroflexota bacterium]|nr:hypothetical protein [Chloroflexota bacterium]
MPSTPEPTGQPTFHSSVVGSAMDGGTVNARNIAGRDIHEHHLTPNQKRRSTSPSSTCRRAAVTRTLPGVNRCWRGWRGWRRS